MTVGFDAKFDESEYVGKHPAAVTIEDVTTFRLQRLVAVGERAAQHWSQELFDLSLNEWRLLALVHARAPARASSVADLLLMDKSQMSRVIKALLSKGLIQSSPDMKDGRAVALEPTERGSALYNRVFIEVMRSNERVLEVLSEEEIYALDVILGKLTAHSFDLFEKRIGRRLVR